MQVAVTKGLEDSKSFIPFPCTGSNAYNCHYTRVSYV